jgi:HK97 gp10 family phage protein
VSQAELKNCMREVNRRLEDLRFRADLALGDFAKEVAGQARQLAPVRKAYSTGKAKDKRRAGYREMNPEEMEALSAMAAKTHWTDKFGIKHAGSLSPNYQTGRFRIKERHQLPRRGITSRNRPDSPYRVLGEVEFAKKKVPYVRTAGGKTQVSKKVRVVKQVPVAMHHERGRIIGTVQIGRASESSPWKIRKTHSTGEGAAVSITGVGRNILKHMNAKQQYDLIHGRGVYLKFNKWGNRAQIVMGGQLRSSIKADGKERFKWMVQATAPYAKYVEFGTRYMEAQPFLYPAMMAARPRMASSIASKIRG